MIEEKYKRSIDTKAVQLRFDEKVAHFSQSILCAIIALIYPISHVVDYFKGAKTSVTGWEITLTICAALMAIVLYIIQKRRLRFKIIETN